MIAITGATGQLGQLVIQALLHKMPAHEIVAAARTPDKAKGFVSAGLHVRHADYGKPQSLLEAFSGVGKLLLISSSDVGRRVPQHRAVIDAATAAGVRFIAYTSLLHADRSPLGLADEHRETEALLEASGVEYVLLRNGWYTENYTAALPAAIAHGVLMGSAGSGRIASAARVDYAEAAAAVLTGENQGGRVYELAGDTAYTLQELAAEMSRQSGKPVRYQDMPEDRYRAALCSAGLPDGVATLLANSDAGAAKNGLFDAGQQLSALIMRPTTPLAATVAAALRGPT